MQGHPRRTDPLPMHPRRMTRKPAVRSEELVGARNMLTSMPRWKMIAAAAVRVVMSGNVEIAARAVRTAVTATAIVEEGRASLSSRTRPLEAAGGGSSLGIRDFGF